jgi:hypothetical protein
MTNLDAAPINRREGDNRLPELAEKIKTGHKVIRDALNVKGLVPKAIVIGRDLNEAKDKVAHGDWKGWLKENCNLSERTASRYMRFANNEGKLEEAAKKKSVKAADLTMADADKAVGAKGGRHAKQLNGVDLPASTASDDDLVKIEDKIIAALKKMKETDVEQAQTSVVAFIKRLRDADLYSGK